MDRLVATVLRGEAVAWPPDAGRAEQVEFLRAAAGHGVTPLVARELHRSGMLAGWPAEVREQLRRAAREQVVVEAVRRRELQRVLAVLAGVQVRPLLMKGVALAYLHYPRPFLRPRADADLLIQKHDMLGVIQAMGALGYRRALQIPGDLVLTQRSLVRKDPSGVRHEYDFHWKIANRHLFADLLSFEELSSRSVEVPALGEDARALGAVDALLLACVHRVAHHHDSGRLLWLYDIHLLAAELDGAAFERFAVLATQKRIGAVCARGLQLARQWFNTTVPEHVVEMLAARGPTEPSAIYLGGRLRPIDTLISDLTALGPWADRWRLLRQHLFPPAGYMGERYAVSSRLLLPALYPYRVVRGAWRIWFRRPARCS